MATRMHILQTTGRRPSSWTQEEQARLRKAYQNDFNALQQHLKAAEAEGENVFVKEHVIWFIEPIAEARYLFGDGSVDGEKPWTVESECPQPHSMGNETVLPDDFLRTWQPTFLIRHPALAFPSCYRTSVDNEGEEAARSQQAVNQVEMSVHWSRTLYDWFLLQRLEESSSAAVDDREDAVLPIILDADDVIEHPDWIREYAEKIGLDAGRLVFDWDVASEEKLRKMSRVARRMTSTLDQSIGVVGGKTAKGLDVEEEAKKWRNEFGEEEGGRIEGLVRAAMPDYEYMKARRLRPHGSR